MADLAVVDIPGVEILAEGKWDASTGEVTITRDDLDALVASAAETADLFEAPIRLGHTEDQKVLWGDGLPRAGVVRNLRRVGSKLVADLKSVPGKLAALLKAGAYGPRSSGISRDYELGGKKYPLMLTHLALLGEQAPAVAGLNDLTALFAGASSEPTEWVPCDLALTSAPSQLAVDLGDVVHRLELAAHGRKGAPAMRALLSKVAASANDYLLAAGDDMDDEREDEPKPRGDMPSGEKPREEEDEMALEKSLREELGLDEGGDILAAVKALRSKGDAALSRDEEVIALKAKVEALEKNDARSRAEAVVNKHRTRVAPSMRDECIEYALSHGAEKADAFFAKLPEFASSTELGAGGDPSDDEVKLTAAEERVAKQMGLDPAKQLEAKKALLASAKS
jgi:hypothetical protein